MRRLMSLFLGAMFVVSVGVPIASAQSAGASYVSTSSNLSFSLPEGWEVIASAPIDLPVLEVGQAVLPSEGRAANVVVSQLNMDITGMAMDDYKAALDQVTASKYQLVSSSIERIPAPRSATGEWVGVLQVVNILKDGVVYEHVQFVVPMADREYTVGVTGGPGTSGANANVAGFIAATLAM
jgi:hypothetical protein